MAKNKTASVRRWLRLIPWIGHRVEKHPIRWAIGAAVLLGLVVSGVVVIF